MSTTPAPLGKKLLLIGWDSADWKIIRPMIEAGELPTLAKLIKRGSTGNLTTLEPVLSPMLWTSIATGKHAFNHGVHGFTEVDPNSGKVVPVSAASRQCRTLWEILGDHGLRSHVVGWFATHGEQNPQVNTVSNLYSHTPKKPLKNPAEWPTPPKGTYWPESLASSLDELRLHPTELDGDLLNLFVPRASEIDQKKDKRLYRLSERLAEAMSVHNATTWLMENEPWDLTAVYFRAIDEICHEFMPFHPPQLPGVKDEDFAMFSDVVKSAYRLHDMLLTRVVHLAGPEAAVMLVSDHGFHSDHLRPRYTPNVPAGIVVWHRRQGIIVAAGPGIAAEESIDGASLLDVTPTVLRWFGLPRGADMQGRVLHDIFFGDPIKHEIPTWELPADSERPNTRPRLAASHNKALLDQFVALGYIDDLPSEPTAAAESTWRENNWQLAQACLHGGRIDEALPLLEDVFSAYPERPDYAQRLATCQLQLGLVHEAEATVEAAIDTFKSPVSVALLRANIAFLKNQPNEALEYLEKVRERTSKALPFLEQLSRVYLKLRRWEECEKVCQQILILDPEHSLAWTAIARCRIHRGEGEAAVEAAVEAVSLSYQNSLAHLNLGLALSLLKRWQEAAHSFRNAIIIKPGFIPPYRLLARVLNRMGHKKDSAAVMERARRMKAVYDFQKTEKRGKRRDGLAARAKSRREARQTKREDQARRQAEAEAAPALDLVIVSGLPRSGTSLMMQMLAAGGLPALSDGQRTADDSNPEGYLEWELIKQLSKNPRLIEQATGKVVKVVSPLLRYLPPKHRYKIIFMRRPIGQVVESQLRMLERSRRKPAADQPNLEKKQTEHVETVLKVLRKVPQVELLEIDYPELVADPVAGAEQIINFLGPEVLTSTDPSTLAAAVKLNLHRQR